MIWIGEKPEQGKINPYAFFFPSASLLRRGSFADVEPMA
jgi:phage head maturation protease